MTKPHNGLPKTRDVRVMAVLVLVVAHIYRSVPGWPVSDTSSGARKSLVIECPHRSVEFSNITFNESMNYVFLAKGQKQVSFGNGSLFFEQAPLKGSLIDL